MDKFLRILKDFIRDSALQDYLVYGSLAYFLYTKENINVADIDIIISKNDFPKIQEQLRDSSYYKVFCYEKTVHVNLVNINGGDGKPFDISLDSYEDYFLDKDFNLTEYQEFEYSGTKLKILPLVKLLEIYKQTAKEHEKGLEYGMKVARLEKILLWK